MISSLNDEEGDIDDEEGGEEEYEVVDVDEDGDGNHDVGAQYTSVHLQAGRCFLSFDLLPAIGAAAGDYLLSGLIVQFRMNIFHPLKCVPYLFCLAFIKILLL